MKNGLDRPDDEASKVVSIASARKRSAKGGQAGRDHARPRHTPGQWLLSALFVVLAIGGVLALAAPLLRAVGILGG